ncbi:hypothetical protein D9M68_837630 [compost metagenome]
MSQFSGSSVGVATAVRRASRSASVTGTSPILPPANLAVMARAGALPAISTTSTDSISTLSSTRSGLTVPGSAMVSSMMTAPLRGAPWLQPNCSIVVVEMYMLQPGSSIR